MNEWSWTPAALPGRGQGWAGPDSGGDSAQGMSPWQLLGLHPGPAPPVLQSAVGTLNLSSVQSLVRPPRGAQTSAVPLAPVAPATAPSPGPYFLAVRMRFPLPGESLLTLQGLVQVLSLLGQLPDHPQREFTASSGGTLHHLWHWICHTPFGSFA